MSRNVLLLGETGAGKSTFINMLTNYYRDGSLNDIKVAIPTKFLQQTETDLPKGSEHSIGDVRSSQTSECTTYHIGKELTFIDTPGLNDTRGGNQDDHNIQLIIDAAERAGSITAVVIIMNGTQARLTLGMKSVIAKLKGHIPDSVLDNCVIVLTNCTEDTANLPSATIHEMISNPTIFHLNNSAFSSDPAKWKNKEILQAEWNTAMRTIETFDTHALKLTAKSAKDFAEMRELRNDIKGFLHGAKLEISSKQKVHDEIAQFKARKAHADSEVEAYKDFKETKQITKRVLLQAPYHSTLCTSCNIVCHDGCRLNETATIGAEIFRGCSAMKSKNKAGIRCCVKCDGKCPYTMHYHARLTMQTVTETIEQEVEDLKSKYKVAVADQQAMDKHLSRREQDLLLHEAHIKAIVRDVDGACKSLKGLCRGFNLVDELAVTLGQMEQEARLLQSHASRLAAEEAIREIRAFTEAMSKDSNQAKASRFCQNWAPAVKPRPAALVRSSSEETTFCTPPSSPGYTRPNFLDMFARKSTPTF